MTKILTNKKLKKTDEKNEEKADKRTDGKN